MTPTRAAVDKQVAAAMAADMAHSHGRESLSLRTIHPSPEGVAQFSGHAIAHHRRQVGMQGFDPRLPANKKPPGIYAERPLRRTAGFSPVPFFFCLNA
jgi:hypothetical protein